LSKLLAKEQWAQPTSKAFPFSDLQTVAAVRGEPKGENCGAFGPGVAEINRQESRANRFPSHKYQLLQ